RADTATLDASRPNGARVPRRWTIRDVTLDGPELGKGFELYAAGVSGEVLGAAGAIIACQAMRLAARVVSKPLLVRLTDDASAALDLPQNCFVELRDLQDVNGARVAAAARGTVPLDVSSNVQVGGDVDAPAGAFAYL